MKKEVKILVAVLSSLLVVIVAVGLIAAVSTSSSAGIRPLHETGADLEAYAYETAESPAEASSPAEGGTADAEGSSNAAQGNAAAVQVPPKTAAKSATILVFMNGSDLETKAGEGSEDIAEMLSSGIGNNVNLVFLTLGTKRWQNYGISSNHSQIYKAKDGELVLLEEDLGDLSLESADTLSSFIEYGKTNFPADRYILLFWDHGGGPVYGVGYDDRKNSDNALTLDNMTEALSRHTDIRFDLIGMDCCIMANVETCLALAPYCRYTVLSEDFESGLGWDYTGWMKEFETNPGMATPDIGKRIIDDMVQANQQDSENGDACSMTMINELAIRGVFSAWMGYAYENEDRLLETNYSTKHMARGRAFFEDDWEMDYSNVTLSDYYISDILAIVENAGAGSENEEALRNRLSTAIAYYAHTGRNDELTGLSVSLPYGDREFYQDLKRIYTNLGFDKEYIDWLEKFVSASGINDHYDYSDFADSWGGWEPCEIGNCGTGGSYDSCESGSYETGGSYDSCEDGSCDYGGYDEDPYGWYYGDPYGDYYDEPYDGYYYEEPYDDCYDYYDYYDYYDEPCY